jgi:hypothetical protein
LFLAGCGDDDDIVIGPTVTVTATRTSTVPPTQTAQPSQTPTPTPPLAAVAGVIVVNRDVGGANDGLKELPPEGMPDVGKGFDRGLGGADWVVDDGVARGTTTDDGHFSITGLTPGRHTIRVTKTVDGNLMELSLPIIVGDDGSAEVVAEVAWGLARTTSTYTAGAAAMRAVFAPNGTYLITRGGAVAELGDYSRALIDSDGDGRFDPQTGACEEIYRCDDGGCGDPEHICLCIGSCPGCEDCPTRACISRRYLSDPSMCGPDGLCKRLPYACGPEQSCSVSGDECTNISSCLGCDDVDGAACVEPCRAGEPIDIDRIEVYGPSTRLVIGQEGGAGATAYLSDGTAMDVTWLATWTSSQPTVASVDGWGRIAALAPGTTGITAALGDVVSASFSVEVVERPTLLQIHLQNASCFYPIAGRDDPVPSGPLPPAMDQQILPPPLCHQVVRIGATIQFMALGQFDTGYYEDITDEVEWSTEPAAVGDVAEGLFTARAAGTASLTARLGTVQSNAVEVRVVTEPTIVALSVYPADWAYSYVDGGPIRDDIAQPCFECGYFLTLLRGDTVRLAATAHYDTGEWEDVTDRVTWRSNAATVASVTAAGVLTAENAGEAAVDATYDGVTSSEVSVRVVNEATLQSLYTYMEGQDLAIGRGAQVVFHAVGYYDVGFDRDVTDQVVWQSSDETVGGFDSAGVFTARNAGTTTIVAALDGQQSAPITLEVYATSELEYCDPGNVNRGTWSDDFNRVTLESDCAEYTLPDVAELRFSVTETQRPGGVFNPCLDLYAYSGETLVRTIREEGCGDPFLAPGAPTRDEEVLKYQLKAFWDLKDALGAPVPAGTYTIRGIFYLYYDPVVELEVRVNDAAPAN